MRLPQLAWCKVKVLSLVSLTALFLGCGIFGGVSIDIRGSSTKDKDFKTPEMTLTVPEEVSFKQEAKAEFLKLIDESLKKVTKSKGDTKETAERLKQFSLLLKQASSEEELYRLVKGSQGKAPFAKHDVTERNQVLFTGYYKPLFKGSLHRSKNYAAPLYSALRLGTALTRRELVTEGLLKANELVYLKDPFEAYLAEIQGSVGILLESGEILHYAFAGSNNQKYLSIGSELVIDGKLKKSEATIPGIRAYFETHPGSMREYILRNPRQVFFRKSLGKTLGSAGVELLKERAVATDRLIYPPGSIIFVKVEIPLKQADGEWGVITLKKFMIALDSGSAIIGPNRIDLFLGDGAKVGEVAGRLNSRGKLEVFE